MEREGEGEGEGEGARERETRNSIPGVVIACRSSAGAVASTSTRNTIIPCAHMPCVHLRMPTYATPSPTDSSLRKIKSSSSNTDDMVGRSVGRAAQQEKIRFDRSSGQASPVTLKSMARLYRLAVAVVKDTGWDGTYGRLQHNSPRTNRASTHHVWLITRHTR